MTRYYQANEISGPWLEVSKVAMRQTLARLRHVDQRVAALHGLIRGEPTRIGAHWYRAETEPQKEQEGLFS